MHRSSRFYRRAPRIVALLLVLTLVWSTTAPAFAGRVFVDPGHGGPYPGAVYGSTSEAYVNLLLAQALRNALAAHGHSVRMSRTSNASPNLADIPTWHYEDDDSVRYYADGLRGIYKYDADQSGSIPYDDLQERCDMANSYGADVFISIHCNASTSSSANGTATYRNPDNVTDEILSARLSTLVQAEMMAATEPYYSVHDDGTKIAGFYVVRWSNMPAILIETAFLSNPYERALLLNSTFRARIASGMAKGIDRFLDEDPFTPRWDRIYGDTRYGTAARIAAINAPSGASTVLLASGENWPDALAATPLSTRLSAPLLLTETDRLPAETCDALEDLDPSQIVVLGGEAAVDATAVAQAASAAGIDPQAVRRIAGATRYETAALIAQEVGIPSTDRVMLVNGLSYADAMSISAKAGIDPTPILLTEPSNLPTAVVEFWSEHPDATKAVVIGGTVAISDSLVSDLRDGSVGLPSKTVTRIWGVDRYATNIAVLDTYWPSANVSPYVSTALNFPDALTAGTLAARTRQPVMLLGGRYLSPYTREWLVNEEARMTDLTIIGGPGALPYLVDWEIEKSLAR